MENLLVGLVSFILLPAGLIMALYGGTGHDDRDWANTFALVVGIIVLVLGVFGIGASLHGEGKAVLDFLVPFA